ncbi:response regulator transcription factor [Nocardia alba]|uniref:Sensory transduction protein RegX3 n=1 Tax=Nocardia alba TaxID=225051 RepID=A0A4R1FY15_9NOCA|nr:response regulator transcription factor [Nocardia alba]TCJ97738.1 DNA-binding response OmpR family regulator [Nocardia alba]
MRVVVVEDDAGVAAAVVEGLRAHGFAVVDHFANGLEVLTSHTGYDAVVLDLGLPDVNGYLVLRQLRKVSSIPVIILTAEGDELAVVSCLRAGADDFMVKPPRVGELAARIETIVRRVSPVDEVVTVVQTGDVRVDLAARHVEVAGAPVSLTQKEFALARVLADQVGVAVSRETIMLEIWGEKTSSTSRALDVHMGALRAKLNRPGLITTIHGFGYRWCR